MTQWHGGKGSKRRKDSDQKAYEDNWERIFGKKQVQQELPTKEELAELKKQAQDRRNG